MPLVRARVGKKLNKYVALRVKQFAERSSGEPNASKLGWGPASIRRWRETAHHFCSWAEKKAGYLTSNPVDGVPCPTIPDREVRFLSSDQIAECLETVVGHMLEPVVATALYAGLRRDELTWLTLRDLDLNREIIHIRPKMDGKVDWFPKTKRIRVVRFEPRLLPYLRKQRLRAGKGPWLFPSVEGKKWDVDNLGHRLSAMMDDAGLPWTFLDFRHTYGSMLAKAGLSALQVSRLLGNSERVCRKHYIGLFNEEIDVRFPEGEEGKKVIPKSR